MGVWVYNVPALNWDYTKDAADGDSGLPKQATPKDNILKHPLVWAACSRFLLCDQFQAKYSPSRE